MSPARVALLTVGPTAAPGVMGLAAWRAVEAAGSVMAHDDLAAAWVGALGEATERLFLVAAATRGEALATLLVDRARQHGPVVWMGSADDDPGLAQALTRRAVAGEDVELEGIVGSWDVPGGALLELVAVMDRLRSPGGCPWDAEQTHESLVPYALEEAFEVAEAVETGDRVGLREELGDLLLQVAFHARVAEDHPDAPFDVDDVARGITAKLRRRHPHVFADGTARTAADVEAGWDRIKQAEKGRESVLDGVPLAMPALSRATKVLGRIDKAGLPGRPVPASSSTDVGEQLLALAERARLDGIDAEAALRQAVRDAEANARAMEGRGGSGSGA